MASAFEEICVYVIYCYKICGSEVHIRTNWGNKIEYEKKMLVHTRSLLKLTFSKESSFFSVHLRFQAQKMGISHRLVCAPSWFIFSLTGKQLEVKVFVCCGHASKVTRGHIDINCFLYSFLKINKMRNMFVFIAFFIRFLGVISVIFNISIKWNTKLNKKKIFNFISKTKSKKI